MHCCLQVRSGNTEAVSNKQRVFDPPHHRLYDSCMHKIDLTGVTSNKYREKKKKMKEKLFDDLGEPVRGEYRAVLGEWVNAAGGQQSAFY